MRKKTVNHLADTIFWYFLYFLPVIAFLLFLIAEPSTTGNAVNFLTFIESCGFGFVQDNFIVAGLRDIFGTGGIMPFFNTDVPFVIFTWYVGVIIAHLFVDFIIFIPKLAHKWLNKFTRSE